MLGSIFRTALVLALLTALGACSTKFRTYDGPEVTRVVVFKEERRMYLMHGDVALKGYDMALGFAPTGHKAAEGDGRTPEGRYRIDKRNPDSRFHLSIGIDYPRPRDVAHARLSGKAPGGDIFIHGNPKRKPGDWTWGCIAVTDREMEDIYAMVRNGTVVDIYPSAARAAPGPVAAPAQATVAAAATAG